MLLNTLSKYLKAAHCLLLMLIFSNLGTAQYVIDYVGTYYYETENPMIVQVNQDSYATVPIGFPFTFYGNEYTHVNVDFNGLLQFGIPENTSCCTETPLPSSSVPKNIIAACYTLAEAKFDDGTNYFNEYQYETIGTFPNRVFIVSFTFNALDCPLDSYYDGQVKLYETSNRIEIHSSVWNGNNENCQVATQGIQDINGFSATFDYFTNADNSWSLDHNFIAFVPILNDLSVPFGDLKSYCVGSNEIKVYVQNKGSNVVSEFDLNWTWDGVPQSTVHFNEVIPADPNYFNTFTLGFKSFSIVGESHILKVWSDSPNGLNDTNNQNDTLTLTLYAGLNGSYTIGGISPDFNTFNDALSTLHTIGACSEVTFNVRPGTYNEQLNINYFNGTSTTFTAENGDSSSVIITQPDVHILKFTNAFNVKFKKLSFIQTGIPIEDAIIISNFSVYDSFQNCVINAAPFTFTSNKSAIQFIDHAGAIGIINSKIIGGSTGINFEGYGGNRDQIVIENNDIINFRNYGISVLNTTGIQIRKNKISSDQFVLSAIQLSNDASGAIIDKNQINLYAGGIRGIYINGIYATDVMTNNMISINSTTDSGINVSGFGFGNYKIVNNSILLYGNENEGAANLRINLAYSDSIVNNVLINSVGGKVYGVGNNIPIYDYNCIFTTGDYIASINSQLYTDFTDLNNVGKDIHSLNLAPVFISNTDLHTNDAQINNVGIGHSLVQTDFDGENRSPTSPDIGADEFVPTCIPVVTSSADSGSGSLRDILTCITDGSAITFTITSINLTSSMDIDKDLTLMGNNPGSKPEIIFNFSGIPGNYGLKVNSGKSLTIKNIDFSAINNPTNKPLITNSGTIHTMNSVTFKKI